MNQNHQVKAYGNFMSGYLAYFESKCHCDSTFTTNKNTRETKVKTGSSPHINSIADVFLIKYNVELLSICTREFTFYSILKILNTIIIIVLLCTHNI